MSFPKVLEKESREVVIESEHPYLNDTNKMYTVTIPGASEITLQFDSQCKTEVWRPLCLLPASQCRGSVPANAVGVHAGHARLRDVLQGRCQVGVAGAAGEVLRFVVPDGAHRHPAGLRLRVVPQVACVYFVCAPRFELTRRVLVSCLCSDGSSVDWGFKLTATGVAVVDKTPADRLPPVLSILLTVLRHRALKAALALVSNDTGSHVSRDLFGAALTPVIGIANTKTSNISLPSGKVRATCCRARACVVARCGG